MKYAWVCLVTALPMMAMSQASAQEEGRPRRDGEMRARMIEEFDADGDGQLNDEERQTAREAMRERRGDRPGRGEGRGREDRPAPPDPNALFDQFDENKDGQLSRDEFMKLTQATRGRRGQRGPGDDRPAGPRAEDEARQGPPTRGPEFGRRPALANRQDGPPGPPPRDDEFGPPPPEPRGPRGPRLGEPGPRGPGFGGPDPNRIFDRFDEDADDHLSRDEFMKLTEWTREMRGQFAQGGPRGRGSRGEGVGGPGRGRPRGDRPPRPQRPDADAPPAAEDADT